ncbi:MAG: methyltransferase domain-containing protein [Myxococcales bacterium]|nr:methyltransferase domain-containing protein [Myxococcales bacterium]
MTDAVRDAYDARAEEYTNLFLDDLDRVPLDREWLGAFARLVSPGAGVVADLGCGPGHVADRLAALGVDAVGYDLSPAMIDEARRAFPGSKFQVGDLTSLDAADSSLAGIVARYSLIHLAPARLGDVFAGWFRVLAPRAPVLVSFFAASSSARHGRPFDHAVVTAHELFPTTVVAQMQSVGFESFESSTRKPLAGERPLDHATILARRGIR